MQAACWLELDAITPLVDLLAISAHKFGGPKGVGALWIRDGVQLQPLLQGGGQERDRRSGTHNVAGIVAMAEALRITAAELIETNERVTRLRDRLVDGLLATCPGSSETVDRAAKVPGSAHMCFAGCRERGAAVPARSGGHLRERRLCVCERRDGGIARARGDGCQFRAGSGRIRFSLGCTTTDDDVDHALATIPAMIERLRGRP